MRHKIWQPEATTIAPVLGVRPVLPELPDEAWFWERQGKGGSPPVHGSRSPWSAVPTAGLDLRGRFRGDRPHD
jgi:hypothetical protein